MDSHDSSDTLLQRIERLEQRNRSLKRGHLVSVLTLGALVLMAQTRADNAVIEARRIVLKDEGGRPRATLSVSSEGSSRFALLDRSGAERAALRVDSAGVASLSFTDNTRFAVVELTSGTLGSPSLTLSGPASAGGRARADLGVMWLPTILEPSVELGRSGTWGGPYLTLLERRGVVSLGGGLFSTGWPSIVLRGGRDSTPRAVLGYVALDSRGAMEQRLPSSLVFFDKDGKVLWVAP